MRSVNQNTKKMPEVCFTNVLPKKMASDYAYSPNRHYYMCI